MNRVDEISRGEIFEAIGTEAVLLIRYSEQFQESCFLENVRNNKINITF